MTLEISEINIRFSVGETPPPLRMAEKPCGERLTASERREIVEDCIRRILAALNRSGER